MSSVLEKTFGGLVQSFLGANSQTSIPLGLAAVPGLKHVSTGLVHFVQRLQTARAISRQEEDFCIERESKEWNRLVTSAGVSSAVVADVLCRALIAQVRGHLVPSLHIHAIKLTQSANLVHKKIGYLYVSQVLHPGAELSLLVVNTLQRDLASANVLQVAAALSAVPSIVSSDLVTSITGNLIHCLRHQKAYIRRRTANMLGLVVKRCGIETPDVVQDLSPHLMHLLTDQDPSVVIAAIDALTKVIQVEKSVDEEQRMQVVKSCVHILEQVLQKALPVDYNAGQMPAPFVQIHMIGCLRNLSKGCGTVTPEVYTVLEALLDQPAVQETALYGVYFECITTLVALPHHDGLIITALQIVLKFLKSSNVDLKFVGLKALASMFTLLEEALTPNHLDAVLDCLYHSDPVLQAKTLHLLCKMANNVNYQAVIRTLLEFGDKTTDKDLQVTIQQRMSEILEKYCADVSWCIEIVTPVLTQRNDEQIQNALIMVLNKGFQDGNSVREAQVCGKLLLEKLTQEAALENVVGLTAAVMNLLFSKDARDVSAAAIAYFLKGLQGHGEVIILSESERVFQCLKSIGLHAPDRRKEVDELLVAYSKSRNLTVRDQAREISQYLVNVELSKTIEKKANQILKGEKVVDFTLSFLDSFVVEAITNGEMPYKPFSLIMTSTSSEGKKYSEASETHLSSPTLLSLGSEDTHSSIMSGLTTVTVASVNRSMLSSKRVWSSQGRVHQKSEGEESIRSRQNSTSQCTDNQENIGTGFCSEDEDKDDEATEGSVELADEADEQSLKTPQPDSSSYSQRSHLAQALFAGLGMGKTK